MRNSIHLTCHGHLKSLLAQLISSSIRTKPFGGINDILLTELEFSSADIKTCLSFTSMLILSLSPRISDEEDGLWAWSVVANL
jgi:hypothetical protein